MQRGHSLGYDLTCLLCRQWFNTDGLAPAGGKAQGEGRFPVNHLFADVHSGRVCIPIRIRAVGIDASAILPARIEEGQANSKMAGLFIRDAPDIPSVPVLARNRDIIADLDRRSRR